MTSSGASSSRSEVAGRRKVMAKAVLMHEIVSWSPFWMLGGSPSLTLKPSMSSILSDSNVEG